jgi:hypothetical protein
MMGRECQVEAAVLISIDRKRVREAEINPGVGSQRR